MLNGHAYVHPGPGHGLDGLAAQQMVVKDVAVVGVEERSTGQALQLDAAGREAVVDESTCLELAAAAEPAAVAGRIATDEQQPVGGEADGQRAGWHVGPH